MMRQKLTIVFLLILLLNACAQKNTVVIKGKTITIEIADDVFERQQGLMYRESLPKDTGMLFVFEENGYHAFWMKNTLIPLDMIFISEDAKIVDIIEAEPCATEPCGTYAPKSPAKYVLEVNKGYSRENKFAIGNPVTIKVKS